MLQSGIHSGCIQYLPKLVVFVILLLQLSSSNYWKTHHKLVQEGRCGRLYEVEAIDRTELMTVEEQGV